MKGLFKKTKYIIIVFLILCLLYLYNRREQFKVADLEIGSFFDVEETPTKDEDECDE